MKRKKGKSMSVTIFSSIPAWITIQELILSTGRMILVSGVSENYSYAQLLYHQYYGAGLSAIETVSFSQFMKLNSEVQRMQHTDEIGKPKMVNITQNTSLFQLNNN